MLPLDDVVTAVASAAPAADSAVPLAGVGVAVGVVVASAPSLVAVVGVVGVAGVAGAVVVTSADDCAGAVASLPGVDLVPVPGA